MLARNAEALYWIGRYAERADDTARMLDVTVHQFLEDATVDEDRVSRQLVRVLGIPEPPADQPLDLRSVTEVVAYNRDPGSGSIAATVASARENARGAREVTSSEMWECLNSTYNGLAERERAARRLGPHEFLNYIKNRAAMFSGLTDSTLSRDEGYRFLLLGRSIERMDMAVRLLLSRAGDRANAPTWVTVLRATGAHDTYLRTHRGVLDATRVVEFILVDRLFPRSVIHALTTAEDCLNAIEGGREGRLGTRTEAQRLLGRARGELEFLAPGELLEDLQRRLLALQELGQAAGEAVTARYFHVTPYVAWTDARARGDIDTILEGEL